VVEGSRGRGVGSVAGVVLCVTRYHSTLQSTVKGRGVRQHQQHSMARQRRQGRAQEVLSHHAPAALRLACSAYPWWNTRAARGGVLLGGGR
jgi:hypothetical protein